MTTIRVVTCAICGEADLDQNEVVLAECQNDPSLSFYAFRCPTCLEIVRKPADGRVVALLRSAPVVLAPWEAEAAPQAAAYPLTLDDILVFHFEVERSDRLVEILESEAAR